MHLTHSVTGLWAPAVMASTLASAASFADVLPLSPSTPTADGHYGASVALAGDIDFDGYSDVIVGAPGEPANGLVGAGRAHVYSGKTGILIRTHVSSSPATNGAFGAAVLGLPDLNGDGRSEYAIGAPNEEGGKGRVRVYSGANGSQIWFANGLAGTFGHGGRLAVVPDCSGDGKVELAVGNGGTVESQTHVRIYQGATGLGWAFLNRPAGVDSNARFGHAIGGIPDVTGDGKGDVIVGAPFADGSGFTNRGAAWIYDGANGALVREVATVDPESNGEFGTAVAGIGDLDGDGRGDVLVGAPREDVSGNDGHGRVHAYSGATGAHLYSVSLPNGWTGAHFGTAIAVAANFDDDGVPDFAVGAPNAGANGSGWVYRFSGATGDVIGYLLSSLGGYKGYGSALSAAGDATQDGRSDLAVGAPTSTASDTAGAGRADLRRIVVNDACGPSSEPFVVGLGGHYFSNVGATNYEYVEGDCDGVAPEELDSDVHFTFLAPASGTATFSTCATGFDTWIAAYRGCEFTQFGCVWGPPDACNDDSPGCPNGGSSVALAVSAGECVRLRVGGVGSAQGIATLHVALAESCLGDLDGDDAINGGDLALLLGVWGQPSAMDLTGDGVVDGADLAALLGAWGSCS